MATDIMSSPGQLTRRRYLATGLLLAALKYAGDTALVYHATGRLWRPFDYLSPVSTLMETRLRTAPPELIPILALWSLPSFWVGISISMRRAHRVPFIGGRPAHSAARGRTG